MATTVTEYNYGSAIQEICKLEGHPVPQDAAGSTDPAVVQMGAAINQALLELLPMRDWQALTVRTTLSVVADSAGQLEKSFSLPTDFLKFAHLTQWSSGASLPAGGPVGNVPWMSYFVRNWSPQLTLYFQLRGNLLYILTPPYPTAVDFAYMYISKAQVWDADTPTDDKDKASKNGDTFKLDSVLVMLLGRAKYRGMKGFDNTGAMNDFNNALADRGDSMKGAPALSISGPVGFPLIDPLTSLPETGYGS